MRLMGHHRAVETQGKALQNGNYIASYQKMSNYKSRKYAIYD